MKRFAWITMLLLVPAAELGAQSTESEILDMARQACAELDGGEFLASDDAVTRVDLDGDEHDGQRRNREQTECFAGGFLTEHGL